MKERLNTKKSYWEAFNYSINENLNLKLSLKKKYYIEKYATTLTNLIQTTAWKSTPAIPLKQGIRNISKDIKTKKETTQKNVAL